MRRWSEQRAARGEVDLEAKAADLFRRVAEPPPLSAVQVQRIGRQIAARARTRQLAWWALATAACLLLALLGARLLTRPPAAGAPSVAVRVVPLGQKWLVLRGGDAPASLELAGVRLSLSPAATVELDLRSGRVWMAAYSGSVRAETVEGVIQLAAGQAWVDGRLVTVDRSRRDDAETALDGVARAATVPAAPKLTRPRGGPAAANGTRPEKASTAAPSGDDPDEPMPDPATAPRASEPSETPEKPSESALSAESRLLGAALRRLSRDHDAVGALEMLDQYRAQFSHGTLFYEAEQVRVDALLQLGRRAEALSLLDQAPLGEMARSAELLQTRAELRAASGRCGEAGADFSSVLARASGELRSRALFGRAGCRGRDGDLDGARADLREYLRQFPSGALAGDARRALEK